MILLFDRYSIQIAIFISVCIHMVILLFQYSEPTVRIELKSDLTRIPIQMEIQEISPEPVQEIKSVVARYVKPKRIARKKITKPQPAAHVIQPKKKHQTKIVKLDGLKPKDRSKGEDGKGPGQTGKPNISNNIKADDKLNKTKPTKELDKSGIAADNSKSGKGDGGGTPSEVVKPTPQVGDRDLPEIVESIQPVYPKMALNMEWAGRIEVEVEIDRDGKPIHLAVVKSTGYPVLDQAFIRTIREGYRFNPRRLYGENVQGKIILSHSFEIN